MMPFLTLLVIAGWGALAFLGTYAAMTYLNRK